MKRLDVGKIGVGNLINFVEVLQSEGAGEIKRIVEMQSGHKAIADNYFKYGEMSNNRYVAPLVYWAFNDGSMVLPDGLVIECKDLSGYIFETSTPCNLEYDIEDPFDSIVAIRILGVTEEYGAQLGLKVIEI